MPLWLRATVFILLLPGTLAGWLPWLLASADRNTPHAAPALRPIGVALVFLGWLILLWCAREFAYRGRGTPAPYDPPQALVTTGLYKYTRNPMYVALLTAILGQALWHWSATVLVYAGIFLIAFHSRVVLYEEPKLTQMFGADYEAYRASVPRWLFRIG